MSNGAIINLTYVLISLVAAFGALSVTYSLFVGKVTMPFVGTVVRRANPTKYWMVLAFFAACIAAIVVFDGPYVVAHFRERL